MFSILNSTFTDSHTILEHDRGSEKRIKYSYQVANHIAHTTNFDKLIVLVVCCGDDDLKRFIESAKRNATYTSKDTVIQFV